jgi:hypothetical protein
MSAGRLVLGLGIGAAAIGLLLRRSSQSSESPSLPRARKNLTLKTHHPMSNITLEQKLQTLEPSTREFARNLIAWAATQGIQAKLGETYRSWEDQKKVDPNRTAIKPGQYSWHAVGRAFHLVITRPDGKLDMPAYKIVGQEANRRGGKWLGGHVIISASGKPFVDTAHFEYHPEFKSLSAYRGTAIAQQELAAANQRAQAAV